MKIQHKMKKKWITTKMLKLRVLLDNKDSCIIDDQGIVRKGRLVLKIK